MGSPLEGRGEDRCQGGQEGPPTPPTHPDEQLREDHVGHGAGQVQGRPPVPVAVGLIHLLLGPVRQERHQQPQVVLHHRPEQLLAQRHVRAGQRGQEELLLVLGPDPTLLLLSAGTGRARPGGRSGERARWGLGGQDPHSRSQPEGPRAVGGSGWRRVWESLDGTLWGETPGGRWGCAGERGRDWGASRAGGFQAGLGGGRGWAAYLALPEQRRRGLPWGAHGRPHLSTTHSPYLGAPAVGFAPLQRALRMRPPPRDVLITVEKGPAVVRL